MKGTHDEIEKALGRYPDVNFFMQNDLNILNEDSSISVLVAIRIIDRQNIDRAGTKLKRCQFDGIYAIPKAVWHELLTELRNALERSL